MIIQWTNHLKTQEEKDRFADSVKGSRLVLERLSQILRQEEDEITRTELSVDSYDNPNWSHKQAFRNGQRSVYRKLQSLTNLDQQKQ
jgi:hypothetical protein